MDASVACLVNELFFSATADETASLLLELDSKDSEAIVLSVATVASMDSKLMGRTKVANFFTAVVPLFTMDEFRSRFRLTRSSFEFLLAEMYTHGVFVAQEHTKEVPYEKQLLVYLDYIGHQCNQSDLEVLYDLSLGKVNEIVHSMSRRIVPTLSSIFIRWPTHAEATNGAGAIMDRHGFPDVLGAIDGCHIEISTAAVEYTTRKYRQAITLQAVAAPSLKFYDIFVGCSGRMHDARVFQYSPLSQQIAAEQMYQLHLLGDGAYPLLDGLMTPFVDNGHLTNVQRCYNQRLSSAKTSGGACFWPAEGKIPKAALYLPAFY